MEIRIPPEYAPLYEDTTGAILKYPHPALRRKAKPVQRLSPEIEELLEQMFVAMRTAHGIGLAAPQLGVGLRVVIIAPPDQVARVLINPQILERSGEQIGLEGCLSLPALYGEVKRAQQVVVRGLNRRGKPVRLELEDLPARIALHEIDHLEGILFIDRALPGSLRWYVPEEVSEEEETTPVG